MVGTGYFPGGEEQAYRTDERDDLCLVGTAEVPVTALHAGEILERTRSCPKLYVAHSSLLPARGRHLRQGHARPLPHAPVPEGRAGGHRRGRRRAERSRTTTRSCANAEEVLQALELPYRVVNVCGGDLGAPQVQKFDIETWMPSRKGYGETHSASRFHDFQARRLNLRYRDADGDVRFCHTLNNTVAASARILIALLENHQRADGTRARARRRCGRTWADASARPPLVRERAARRVGVGPLGAARCRPRLPPPSSCRRGVRADRRAAGGGPAAAVAPSAPVGRASSRDHRHRDRAPRAPAQSASERRITRL